MNRWLEWYVVNFFLGLMSVLLMVFVVALALLAYCSEEDLVKILWYLQA